MSKQFKLLQWLREPLVHFVVLGGLTFVVYDQATGEAQADSRRIVVTTEKQDELASEFEERAGRAPDSSERERIVEGHIREELLYREGLSLGLDRDDPVVRRRVIKKAQFVRGSYDVIADPTEEQLQTFLDENAARYAKDQRFDFEQYFVAEREDRDAEAEANEILSALESGAKVEGKGDQHTRGRMYSNDRIVQSHGQAFADLIVQQQSGTWVALQGDNGWHVTKLEKIHASSTPPLAEVRNQVTLDWKNAERGRAAQEVIEQLRGEYEIVVEGV